MVTNMWAIQIKINIKYQIKINITNMNNLNKGLGDKRYYQTKDILVTAVLCYFKHYAERVAWESEEKDGAYFYIPIQANTQSVLEIFYKGEAMVEPRSFNAILKDLKRMVFEAKKGLK